LDLDVRPSKIRKPKSKISRGHRRLLHRDLELDALTLDHHGPRIDSHDAKLRDDFSFSNHRSVDHRFGPGAHHCAGQLQLTRLLAQVLDQYLSLMLLIGLLVDRLS
jgi:hypothetical protein